eukprot:TRINITY_DN6136_c0_g1_i3.p1 TRINITY_DN6136_c0_g1~~TRINITY_DN6136_c0_g1_i3.p1  ORF type:complete len:309 (+),score=67.31 TRINITY_DN6136_c0_g1_i3:38-928(+)
MSLEIVLKKVDKVYRPGDMIEGVIKVTSDGTLSHQGITMTLHGSVGLHLSAKSVGLFEAFYNSLQPVTLIHYDLEVLQAGKLPDGVTQIPFEFPLECTEDVPLQETYHGVFVNTTYLITCQMPRGMFSKDLEDNTEFLVEIPLGEEPESEEIKFEISPKSLENVSEDNISKIPDFKISGCLDSGLCAITEPLTGEVVVEYSEATIKSIELQLVRVETCGSADGWAKEATEIQNIQICDGDVCRKLTVPIYMVFPRLFTCPTLATRNYKIEFEVNLVILLSDGHLITENFPIKIFRP